ncbi:hypothetical protein [Clavibacter capsici]|uniref:hypothetical protein n=1 Tax=Clavibacter capsici TaxID=1874630 RepID=UPI00293F27A9|nr:hypothetical protein [Clavibacter capsici]
MLTRFAKEITSPGGAIGGGIFFLVFGLIATAQTLVDPGRVGHRGTPFAVLAGGMLLVGIVTLLAGLTARRMRARVARDEADGEPAADGATGGDEGTSRP